MIELSAEHEERLRQQAMRLGIEPSELLAQLIDSLLIEDERPFDQAEGTTYRPPLGTLAALENGNVTMGGRGYVPEPKAPAFFRARRSDGVRVNSQISFGGEPGPSLSVSDGERHARTEAIMPLHWILIDMAPAGWRFVFDVVEDVVRRSRAGEEVPNCYGTDSSWGYPRPRKG